MICHKKILLSQKGNKFHGNGSSIIAYSGFIATCIGSIVACIKHP